MSSRAQRVLLALERWASTGRANSAVLTWGFLQGTFFPGFVDIVWVPLALARPERAYRLALLSATSTVIASAALYLFGAQFLSALSSSTAQWLGVGPQALAHMHELLDHYGWMAILASTVSPLSTKLTSIASGAFRVPFGEFVLALGAGRVSRVLAIAWLVRNGGAERVRRWSGIAATANCESKPLITTETGR